MRRRLRKSLNLTVDLFGIKTILLAVAGLIVIKLTDPAHVVKWSVIVFGGLAVTVFVYNLLVRAGSFLRREDARLNRELEIRNAFGVGQQILGRSPSREASAPIVEAWLEETQAWELTTYALLKKCSQQAALTFRDDANITATFDLSAPQGDTQKWLRILNRRLENLTNITKNPDTYLND